MACRSQSAQLSDSTKTTRRRAWCGRTQARSRLEQAGVVTVEGAAMQVEHIGLAGQPGQRQEQALAAEAGVGGRVGMHRRHPPGEQQPPKRSSASASAASLASAPPST
jgi:hypothetical protein